MFDRKYIRRLIALIIAIGVMMLGSMVGAEIKTYEGVDDTSYVGELEMPDIVQLRALEKAKRNARERAGVYLASYSRMKDLNPTEDELTTVTNNISEVLESECKPELVEIDGVELLRYRARVLVRIDTDGLDDWLRRTPSERAALIAQTKEAKRASLENDRQVADLRRLAAVAKTPEERARLKREFDSADREFLANQKLQAGYRQDYRKEYRRAIALYDEAIELRPDYASAYSNRGAAYVMLEDYDHALADFTRAIELKPWDAAAYNNRGVFYSIVKDYERALLDYSKVIELNPNLPQPYYNRGKMYAVMAEYERAVEDLTRAIELNPDYISAYRVRGACYAKLRRTSESQSDFDKAKALGSNG